MIRKGIRKLSWWRFLLVFSIVGTVGWYSQKYTSDIIEKVNYEGVILLDYHDYYELYTEQTRVCFDLPAKLNGKNIYIDAFMAANEEYHYVNYNRGFDDVVTSYDYGFFTGEDATSSHTPRREGYPTFYGWWTSLNRSEGIEIISTNLGVNQTHVKNGMVLYPMFFDSSYTFIKNTLPTYLDSKGNYALLTDVIPAAGFNGFEVNSTYSFYNAFNGVFDGNYFKIKNLDLSVTSSRPYSALFALIGEQGVVKNLEIQGSNTIYNSSSVYYAFGAGFAAFNNGTIYNVINNVSVNVTNPLGVAFAGGIVASIGYDKKTSGRIYNAVNEANISASGEDSFAAGILATNGEYYQDLYVSHSINRGRISTNGINNKNTTAGGIVSHGVVGVHNSYNEGDIITPGLFTNALGGITGYIRNSSMHNRPPVNCVWLKKDTTLALYGVGSYPDDTTGGNNDGVIVGEEVTQEMVSTLNDTEVVFSLSGEKITLIFESKFK